MPPAIAAFAVWAGISVAAAYAIVAVVVLSAGMAVYGSAQARRAERDNRNAMNAGMRDRLVTRVATEAPHRIIYGRAKVGSDVVAMFTSGDKDQFKHIVCVHAAHECDSIEEVWINNVPVGPVTAEGDVTTGRHATTPGREIMEEIHVGPTFDIDRPPVAGSVRAYIGDGSNMTAVAVTLVNGRSITVDSSASVIVSYEYRVGSKFGEWVNSAIMPISKPVVRVSRHLGGPDAVADPYLMSVLGARWPAAAVLRGLCYTVVTLDLNHPEFQGGLVPIHALIRGKKLYDPRTGLTAWSQNPALAIYDYLTSKLCGVPAADLPVAQFIAAANVCDEASNIGSEKKYTINGAITSDQNPTAILESMTQCMAGGLVSTTWDVFAGKYVAPVASLTQDDVVGGMQITPGASDAAIYNGVKGQYISAENKHVMTDFKPYQNAVYRASDARDLYTNIDFPFTDALQRATNLARIFTEDQRNGFTIKAEFSLKAWPRRVGERITFTSAFLGQTAKVYRITDKSYSPNSAVQLTLKEDAASIWDFADATELDSTPNTDLPDPWEIADLASISCTSGEATLLRQSDGTMVPRILVTWPAATTQAVFTNGEIEIEWRAVSTTTWEKAIVTGSETQAYLSPITPGYFYHVRARCVNPYLNTKSGWITTTYQVQVFTARPIVYSWAASQPAPPTGADAYTWGTQAHGAPAGWSLAVPTAPAGGDVSLWEASLLVSDISASGSTAFDWSVSTVVAIGYAPSAAGAGPAGYSNARVYAYQRKPTVPAGTPGAVNYDFTSGTITTATLANGWLKTMPASDGNPLYVTSASASSAGTTDSIAAGEWSGAVVLAYDGGAGTAGLNNATVTLYQRAATATAPAKPSALATYTFVTGALTGINNGWTPYIPTAGGAYLHTTFATAIATTATDTIAASEWAAVQLMYDATDLIAARAVADAAALEADAASVALEAVFADGVLSRDEKPGLIQRWAAIDGEDDLLLAQALALGVPTTGYSASITALAQYLGGLSPAWNDLTQHTNITRGVSDAKWNDYYSAKVALLNAMYSKVKADAAADATTKASNAQANAIATAATAAQAKADLAEVTAKAYADGIVTAEEARAIADATNKANSAQAAATAAAVAADAAIVVGGRNLYPDSGFERGTHPCTDKSAPVALVTIGNVPGIGVFAGSKALYFESGGGNAYLYLGGGRAPVVAGRQYVLSFYYKSGSGAASSSTYFRMSDGEVFLCALTSLGTSATWTRHIQQWTCPAGITDLEPRFGYISSGDAWMSVDCVQIEEGNKATQWTPSPEDIAADATAKADAAQVNAIATAATAAQAKADLAEVTAKAYADGIVTAEEARAIADATNKANAAQSAATAAAALDATAKANLAATTANWSGVANNDGQRPANGATVGAPAGTPVGSTAAELVEARANAALPATPGFTLTAYLDGTQEAPRNTPLGVACSASTTGSVGTVTRAWTFTRSGISNASFSATIAPNGSTADVNCNSSLAGTLYITTECRATDNSTGITRVKTGFIEFTWT